jgi:hypothetical protein
MFCGNYFGCPLFHCRVVGKDLPRILVNGTGLAVWSGQTKQKNGGYSVAIMATFIFHG